MKKHGHYQTQAHHTSLPNITTNNISLNICGQILDSDAVQKSSEPKQAAESCSGTYKDMITTQFILISVAKQLC